MSLTEQITQDLFDVFQEIVPAPTKWKPSTKKIRPTDIEESLSCFYEKARQLRRAHSLGIVTRARIVLRLQHAFNSAGYPSDMTRQVLFSLILSAFVGRV